MKMPEATKCQEPGTLQEKKCVECPNGDAPYKENLAEEKVQRQSPREPHPVRSYPEKNAECPDGEHFPRDPRIPTSDGNCREMLDHTQNDEQCPGPLGQYPSAKDHSVPLEYWAPLADLTHSRPAVESLSINRYSPAEWRLHRDRIFNASQGSVQRGRVAAFNMHRCMKRVYAQTDKDQLDNNIKLDARLGLIHRWKFELQRDIADFTSEVNALRSEDKRLSRCLQALHLVESIDKDVKSVRCLRMEHELVRDEVEEELSNELDLCADINNLYVRYADQIKTQIRELKDAKQRLEVDLTDKEDAWNIDVACRALDSKSPTLGWKPGSVQIPPDQSTPGSYEHYCKEALMVSQAALQRSKILRLNLRDVYGKSVNDLRVQADRIDMALSRKVDDTVQDISRMENELAQCLKALSEAEALVTETREATKRLDGAMKCAQTRLELRHHRNKVENCRDFPHFGLIDEVKTLSESVSAMLSQINVATNSIDELSKARETLEKNIVIKRKTLWVDRDRCQMLRSFYPTVQALAGH